MMLVAFMLLQAATPSPAIAPEKPVASEKKVCRKAEATGTRLGAAKVCRTTAEWAALDNANQREAGQIQAASRRN